MTCSRVPPGTGTEPSLGRDLALGTAIGGSLGGLGAVLSRFPVGPPTLRCGALGGGLAACYLPITRFLGEQRGTLTGDGRFPDRPTPSTSG